MQATYPDTYINVASVKFSLTPSEADQLRFILNKEGVKKLIDTNFLQVDNLIHHNEINSLPKNIIISEMKMDRLLKIYNNVLANQDKINANQVMQWLICEDGPYVTVLSSEAVRKGITIDNYFDEMRKLGNISPDKMQRWDQIRELNFSREHARFRDQKGWVAKIEEHFKQSKEFIESSKVILLEHLELNKALQAALNISNETIQEATTRYFNDYFTRNNMKVLDIQYYNKKGGVQHGKEAVVRFIKEGKEDAIKFYVKTHQAGAKSNSSNTEAVDPKELIIYKILEYTGIGPKAHFYFNPLSPGGFYIATQDSAYTKTKVKRKNFETFDRLQEQYDKSLLSENPLKEDIHNFTKIDLLFRILDITDLNSGNFGVVSFAAESKKNKWKVIDFRNIEETFYHNEDILSEQLKTTQYSYSTYLAHITERLDKNERINFLNDAILDLDHGVGKRMPLIDAIKTAFIEIIDYIKHNHVNLGLNINFLLGKFCTSEPNVFIKEISSYDPKDIGDIGRYFQGIIQNLEKFKSDLKNVLSNMQFSNLKTDESKSSLEEQLSGNTHTQSNQYKPS